MRKILMIVVGQNERNASLVVIVDRNERDTHNCSGRY